LNKSRTLPSIDFDIQGKCNLHLGDAVSWLKSLNDETVDLLITDPPYESLEKHRKIGTTTRLKNSKASSNKWFEIFPNSRFEDLLVEIYRVLKKNSHFYLLCDQETAFIIKPIAEKVGFKFWKPIIWDKVKIGMGYHYRARYEFILFFEKGKRKITNLSTPDILTVPRIHRGYPTEKPVELIEILIEQSSNKGELVCDPFMGSCSTGKATLNLNRRFIGNDLCEEAYEISIERVLLNE
jgi:site-specific DNA-methyltransferase (adenine-specific)